MWWWCKPAPASQPAVGQAKKESYPAQDIYHTRQQTESNSTSRHSVTLTCLSLLCIGRNDGTATSREKQIKYIVTRVYCAADIWLSAPARECRKHVRELMSSRLIKESFVTWQPHSI